MLNSIKYGTVILCLVAVTGCTDAGRSSRSAAEVSSVPLDESLFVRLITREEIVSKGIFLEGMFRSTGYEVVSNLDTLAKLLTAFPNLQVDLNTQSVAASMTIDCDNTLSPNRCFGCDTNDSTIYLLSVDSKLARSRLIIGAILMEPCDRHSVEIPVYVLQGFFNRPRVSQQPTPYLLDISVFGFRTKKLVSKSLLVL
jgi:hypothetical protein